MLNNVLLMLLRTGDAAIAITALLPASHTAAAVRALFQLMVVQPYVNRVTVELCFQGDKAKQGEVINPLPAG
jgi:hypothetical protein